jgi:hypothetical protein
MKGKFGIAALLLSSITFAAPVSTPNPNLSDTPIISGGGNVSGGGTCREYQNDGTAVPLSGGEMLVFYGGGSNGGSAGGYLSTKTTYSGIAYVRTSGRDGGCYCVRYYYIFSCQEWSCLSGSGIGLFASPNDTSQNSFIAGAGAGFSNKNGGGWYGEGGGNIYYGTWFREELIPRVIQYCYPKCSQIDIGSWICGTVCNVLDYGYDSGGGVGLHGGNRTVGTGGGASSISAYYNSPLRIREATTLWNTLTVVGGGWYGAGRPILYVCQ